MSSRIYGENLGLSQMNRLLSDAVFLCQAILAKPGIFRVFPGSLHPAYVDALGEP